MTDADHWIKLLRKTMRTIAETTPQLSEEQRREVAGILVQAQAMIMHESA